MEQVLSWMKKMNKNKNIYLDYIIDNFKIINENSDRECYWTWERMMFMSKEEFNFESSKDQETKYYYAKYTCMNCQKTILKKIEFGKSIPHLVKDEFSLKYGGILAPVCEYCGCQQWSYGKYSG